MSTEIYSETETLSVSNLMFCRVIAFARDFARERATSPLENQWIEKFAHLEEKSSQSVFISETFSSSEEVKFWSDILWYCAQAIYDRKIGNQENQEWQVNTIWALCQFALMLYHDYYVFQRREMVEAGIVLPDPKWKAACQRRYNRLQHKLSRTLREMEEVGARMIPSGLE